VRPTRGRFLWACALGVALSGCPWLEDLRAPFNASGWFDGSWDGARAGDEQALVECVMAVGLAHDPDAGLGRRRHVEGTARFTFWCAAPEEPTADTPWPRELEFDVDGVVWPGGRLTFGGAASGEFGEAHLHLDGDGEDVNGDGAMDGLFGEFCLRVDVPDGTRESVSGTFGVIHLE